jgi:uncharacterized protein (TIGR03435 family)
MRIAIGLLLLCCSALGQTAFEAASIKSAAVRTPKEPQNKIVFTPGTLDVRGSTLRSLIALAYGVEEFQVTGRDLESGRYDILAKAADGAAPDRLKVMLQGLLTERFRLAFHREQKELPVYALVLGKKELKLTPASAEGSGASLKAGAIVYQGASIAKLIELLSRMPLDHPIVDRTGLAGFFDFSVQFSDSSNPADMGEAKRSIEAAFRDPAMAARVADKLGLKLEPRKMPMEILAIDHAERPVEN